MRNPKLSRYAFFDARMERWIKQGRGKGNGPDYLPWLRCWDVKSKGRKHRLPGILHDRILHLMSDLERNAVLHFERMPQVIDIREQFPLDREITRSIAKAMGVPHPADPGTKEHIVMTTDLLIDFRARDGRIVTRAFSVKQAKDLLDQRVQSKQEIERRYWERFGYRWKPLLDVTLRRTSYFNAILWARDWFEFPTNIAVPPSVWSRRCDIVVTQISWGEASDLRDLIERCDAAGSFGPGEVLSTLRHLIARGRVLYDFELGEPTLATSLSNFSLREGIAGMKSAAA